MMVKAKMLMIKNIIAITVRPLPRKNISVTADVKFRMTESELPVVMKIIMFFFSFINNNKINFVFNFQLLLKISHLIKISITRHDLRTDHIAIRHHSRNITHPNHHQALVHVYLLS